jgi:hypothetical protein
MLSLVENRRFVDEAADVTGSYDVSILHGGDGSLLTPVYHHIGCMLKSQLDWIYQWDGPQESVELPWYLG